MIPVVWHENKRSLFAHEGTFGRRRYYATNMLNDMLDTYECSHIVAYDEGFPRFIDGAVVIVHGGHQKDQVEEINADIASLNWAIVIGMGDEESEFPYHKLVHDNMKLWIQSPIPGVHKADRFHLFGYAPDTHKYSVRNLDRRWDWFFSGQTTHDRRREMVRALKGIPGGYLVESEGFGQGLTHQAYFDAMSRAKVVLCPTGPACPDSFRFAEAMENGCIPIVDSIPTWKAATFPYGFWEMMFPQGMPFPIVRNWENELPATMDRILNNYEQTRLACQAWWIAYKMDYYSWLREDLIAVGAL